MRDNLVRWKLRIEGERRRSAELFVVESLRVWPTARPEEVREVPRAEEER